MKKVKIKEAKDKREKLNCSLKWSVQRYTELLERESMSCQIPRPLGLHLISLNHYCQRIGNGCNYFRHSESVPSSWIFFSDAAAAILQALGQLTPQRFDPPIVWSMWGEGGRICTHPEEQLRSRISVVSKVYTARNPAWQFPLSAELLWFAVSVCLYIGHFTVATIFSEEPVGTKVGDWLF